MEENRKKELSRIARRIKRIEAKLEQLPNLSVKYEAYTAELSQLYVQQDRLLD